MPELLCHLFGDYVLQNHWMATEKTKRWLPAVLHAVIYSLPFVLVFGLTLKGWLVLAGTHAVIDRYRLASYWCKFYGIGQPAEWVRLRRKYRHDGPMLAGFFAFEFYPAEAKTVEPTPPFLAVWLLIIVDNTFHMAINHLALQL